MKAIIDGDIVTFRAAFSAEEEIEDWVCKARTDDVVNGILQSTGADEHEVWLSGPNNFRYGVYPEYKANRLKQPRPKWEQVVKQYLVDVWGAKYSDGCEADDMMGISQCSQKNTIICTIDKDLNMIPGLHYNFVRGEQYHVTEEEGMKYFFYQLIVGDPTDNIKGVVGAGKKKAQHVLERNDSLEDIFQEIKDMYSCDEELEMNAACLWIWRKENDQWRLDTHDPTRS